MIRVGVAGWDYKDWWGRVYPAPRPRGFDPLSYLANYFDTIEVNSTFYRPAEPRTTASWAKRVGHNAAFRFTAKLWRRFTHERDRAWTADEVDAVRAGLDPLSEAGRLGCVLVQFPWSFKRDPKSEEWLSDVLRVFAAYPLAVEVRHSSWADPAFYGMLREAGVGVVNIDQPLFHHSIKPGATVTAPTGYVRLHGRNYDNWFRDSAESHERYDYLYSAEELRGWLDRIHEVASRARETYVVTNNHFLGQEVVNAAMLRKFLAPGDVVEVPAELFAAYRGILETAGVRATAKKAPGLFE